MAIGFVNGLLCTPGIYVRAPYEDYILKSSTTFTIPVGARYVQISCIGGGGGGGSINHHSGSGGGGGGGSGYIAHGTKQACIPLKTISVVVGAGGAGGTTNINGTSGGSSYASGVGLTTVTAAGGRYGCQNGTTYWGQGGYGGHGGGGGGQQEASCGAGGNGANALGGAQNSTSSICEVYAKRCGGGSYTGAGTTTVMYSSENNGGKSASNHSYLYLFQDNQSTTNYYVGKGGEGGRGNPIKAWNNGGYGGNGGAPQGMKGTAVGMGGAGASWTGGLVSGSAGSSGVVGIRVYYTER